MDRRFMPMDRGMLFEFERDAPVAFWMKNTYIPLDMVFIARNGAVTSGRRSRRAALGDADPVGRSVRGGARTQWRRRRPDRPEGWR